MKLSRILLWILGILALLVGAILLFAPESVTVTRKASVQAPIDHAFAQVNNLENWKNWMPWYADDPNMKITYADTRVGTGASYSWAGEVAGKGKLDIVESKDNESIKTLIAFEGMGESKGKWTFEEKGEQTEVSWSMTSEAGYNPIGRVFNLFMDGALGPDVEKGLKNLEEAAIASYKKEQEMMKKENEGVEGEVEAG